MSDILQSTVNPKVKRLIRLRDKRSREREGVILIEGRPELDRYLESFKDVKELYFCPEFLKDMSLIEQMSSTVKKYEMSTQVFTKCAYGHRMEGIIAVVSKPSRSLPDMVNGARPLFVIIEQVEKPGNLGAILRSCDGVGVDAVLVCDLKVDLYNPNVIRSSLGTLFSQCVVALSREEAYAYLTQQHVRIYAAAPDTDKHYTSIDWSGPSALVVGAEHAGLTDFWLQQASERIHIPMRGKADSLNVSVSTAVILYEAMRQRHG